MFKSAALTFWIILISIISSFSFAQEKKTAPQPEKVIFQGYPIVLGDQVLFYLKGDVKGYSPEERAKTISERIKKIAEDPDIPIQMVTTSDFREPITLLSAGDKLLFPILDQDAQAEGRTREQLAKEYAEKLRTAMEKYRRDRSHERLIYSVAYTILTTLALIAILIILKILYRQIDQRVLSAIVARVPSIHIQSFQIVQAERVKAIIMGTIKAIRLMIVLAVLYTYLHLVLSFFPWTRPIASRILDYLLLPIKTIGLGIIAHIPNLLFIAVLVLIARYILKLMKYLFLEIENRTIQFSGFYPEWAKPTYKILSYSVIVFFVVMAYPYIPGSESQAFKGVSIFVGVLFSLGSHSTVSNTIAGFGLTYRRAFKVGDRVKIAEYTGDVIETRLQVTTLRTIKNEDIVLPNGLIINGPVINYSVETREKGLILHTTVTIGYDAPWRKVHELLLKAAERTEGILREPAPFILQKSLGDFYVTYELNAYTDKPQEMSQAYSHLHQNIQDAFNQGGVEIMSPHYTQVRDGNRVTIPESYLPKNYVPGALRILQTGNKA
jgi:small-conductance mechanosensitive channel